MGSLALNLTLEPTPSDQLEPPSSSTTSQIIVAPGRRMAHMDIIWVPHYTTIALTTHTGLERLSDTVAWFPESFQPPTTPSPQELLHAAVSDLYLKNDNTLPLVRSLVADIEDLALMYNPATPETTEEQRVPTPLNSNEPPPSLLSTPWPLSLRCSISIAQMNFFP